MNAGWFRWRHATAHTLSEHGHESLHVWWLGADDVLRYVRVAAVEAPGGRELHVDDDEPLLTGDVQEMLLRELREDVELWDNQRARWHADLLREESMIDRLLAEWSRNGDH